MLLLLLLSPVFTQRTYFYCITKVEDTLFKVPRKPFEDQSDIFRSMFLLPPEGNAQHDGVTDDKPVKLEGINKVDFRAFLRVLLPP